MDFIDKASAELAPRQRTHVANHVRTIAEQTLDALLRIEEQNQKLIEYFEAQGATVTRVDDEVQIEIPEDQLSMSQFVNKADLEKAMSAKEAVIAKAQQKTNNTSRKPRSL